MADQHTSSGGRRRSGRAGRAAACAAVALVLAAQVAALALGTQARAWPFLRYQMYARAGGSRFIHRDLCVRFPDGPASIDHWDLAIPRWRFDRLLSVAAGDGPEAERTRRLLSRQVGRVRGPHRSLAVWRRAYTMGPHGLEDAAPPWELEAEWPAVAVDPSGRIVLPRIREADRLRAEACS